MLQSFQHNRALLAAALCSIAVSGCAQTQYSAQGSNPADYSATRITYLPTELSSALQQASAGQQMLLKQSPWGDNVTLNIADSYFSAAGKPCIKASVGASLHTQELVICQYTQQRWGATRALPQLRVP